MASDFIFKNHSYYCQLYCASWVAQLVVTLPTEPKVPGSIPTENNICVHEFVDYVSGCFFVSNTRTAVARLKKL